MFYGRDGFKKDRGNTAYHIEVDTAGGAYGVAQQIKVPISRTKTSNYNLSF